MAPENVQPCPQCGVSALTARIFRGRSFCSGCRSELVFCRNCGAANLAGSTFCHNCRKPVGRACGHCGALNLVSSRFCHNCGKLVWEEASDVSVTPSFTVEAKSSLSESLSDTGLLEPLRQVVDYLGLEPLKESPDALVQPPESKTQSQPQVERMRLCTSCRKSIGESEPFCSYCGAKQAIVHPGPQAALDPYTMKVALTMLARVTEAKDHREYSAIDQLTTLIAEVALGKEKPHDALELSFSDQLRLLTLVFEYTRDKVGYKGEAFGEHIRWPWETVKTGGDCDCKVVLLATMLASLAFRRMHVLVLPPGTYLDTEGGSEKKIQGHVILEVELSDNGRGTPVRLDPSCSDCDIDETPESLQPFLQSFYRIPIIS